MVKNMMDKNLTAGIDPMTSAKLAAEAAFEELQKREGNDQW